MTLERRLGVSAIWLFAALAIVFAPALDGPGLTGAERLALPETLGPKILAPASYEAVAQDERAASLVTRATTSLLGLLALVVLPVAFVGTARVDHTRSAAPSQVPQSRRSSRAPPLPS